MLQIGNILQSLGYFLPYTYLSTYAVQQLHVSTTMATALLVLINVTSIPGGIVIGGLGDHLHITTTILISTLGSALAVFLVLGLLQPNSNARCVQHYLWLFRRRLQLDMVRSIARAQGSKPCTRYGVHLRPSCRWKGYRQCNQRTVECRVSDQQWMDEGWEKLGL